MSIKRDMYKKIKHPILSIICPTFERLKGLEVLISKVDEDFLKYDLIEIIVTDDSSTNLVENYCLNNKYLTYKRHKNSTNPIDNWNYGMKLAKGSYVQVLHHDEYPENNTTYTGIINTLNEDLYDFVIPKCCFDSKTKKCFYKFAQSLFIRKLILVFPFLLLGFNAIGSPSLFIHKNHGQIFDSKLAYLVDVDFYFRLLFLLRENNKIHFSKDAFVSDLEFNNTITNSLTKELKEITLKEQLYNLNKYNDGLSYQSRIFIKITFFLHRFVKNIKVIRFGLVRYVFPKKRNG